MKVYLSFSFLFLMSCGSKMPPITSCLSDVDRQVFHCLDRDGKEFDCLFSDKKCADKLVAIPFQDFGVVEQYCEDLKSK